MSTASKTFGRSISRKASDHLRAFRGEVDRRFPGRISQVILFGSRARGDAHSDSDYDVAVFVHGLTSSRDLNHALSEIAYSHILDGVHIRPVAVPSDFLESNGQRGLALSIAREGVPIP